MDKEITDLAKLLGKKIHEKHIRTSKELREEIGKEETSDMIRVFSFETPELREEHRKLTYADCHIR